MKKHKSKCGLFGFYSNKPMKLSNLVNGLKKLQHRGRESCGITYVKNDSIVSHKVIGLVSTLEKEIIEQEINIGIGHVRYSTSGSKSLIDVVQPLKSEYFSIAHNGNIPNIDKLKKKLNIPTKIGINMNDTAVLKYIIEKKINVIDGLKFILDNIECSYCLLIMMKNKLYCMRDRYGFKPLSMGSLVDGWVVSSESIACDSRVIVDIKPGEIVRIDEDGPELIYSNTINPIYRKLCSFEFIYFMNYKSIAEELSIKSIRFLVGKLLAEEDENSYPENTIVVGAPNSGIIYGKGYAFQKKLEYLQIIQKIKPKRSFILPTNLERNSSIKKNIIFLEDKIKDNEIIIVDDSIVRGNTTKNYIKKLKELGALKVHIKSAFPKIISPCYYGLDFPTYGELIGNGNSIDEIKEIIKADSVQFSKIETIQKIIKPKNGNICISCLTDKHESKLLEW